MSIRTSLAWMSICQLLSFALLFGSSVVVAHYLSPKEMGVFGVGAAIVGFISVIQQLSLPAFIVREEELTEEVIATAFSVNAVLTVLLSLLIAAASFGGAYLFKEPGVRNVLLILAITPLTGILAFIPSSILEREGKFRFIALINLASNLASSATTITLTIRGFSYMSLAYGQLVGAVVLTTLMIIVGWERFHTRMGFGRWRRVANFSSQMLIVQGVNTATTRLTEIALGRILGLAMLGLYNRASGMNNLLWSNIHYLVARVFLVEFSELNRRQESLRRRYMQVVEIMTALLWPAFAGLAVIARPLIAFVYGPKWLPAAGPFVLLAIASMVAVPMTMTWELFTGTGRLWIQTRIETIRAAILCSMFIAACFVSLKAAAATRIFDGILAFVLYRRHVSQMTDTRLNEFWGIYFRSAALAIIGVAPAAALVFTSAGGLPSIQLVFGAALFGAVLWLVALAAVNHPLWHQIRHVWIAVLTYFSERPQRRLES